MTMRRRSCTLGSSTVPRIRFANAEATGVEGIKREFRISIDVYLDSCKELGIEPVKPQPIAKEAS